MRFAFSKRIMVECAKIDSEGVGGVQCAVGGCGQVATLFSAIVPCFPRECSHGARCRLWRSAYRHHHQHNATQLSHNQALQATMSGKRNEVAKFETFKQFYPYYLSEHSNKTNRTLHFIGTAIAHLLLIYFLINGKYSSIPLVFIPGYAFAWVINTSSPHLSSPYQLYTYRSGILFLRKTSQQLLSILSILSWEI